MSNPLGPHGLYSPWNSPGQNTGVGSFPLLQGIFPTQGLAPGLPYCSRILYQLSHKGSPRILEWVAYPFSSGSSQPRNRTGVSCIAGRFFTSWGSLVYQLFLPGIVPLGSHWKSLLYPRWDSSSFSPLSTIVAACVLSMFFIKLTKFISTAETFYHE